MAFDSRCSAIKTTGGHSYERGDAAGGGLRRSLCSVCRHVGIEAATDAAVTRISERLTERSDAGARFGALAEREGISALV
jgi:hypothetical protein